jgi:hypothetical protein
LKRHRLPKIIIPDRDPKFTAKFWKCLFKTVETELRFSTERDGERKRLKQNLQMMLRHCVEYHVNNWNQNFRILDFAYRSASYSASVKSPFSLVYGTNADSPKSIVLTTAES